MRYVNILDFQVIIDLEHQNATHRIYTFEYWIIPTCFSTYRTSWINLEQNGSDCDRMRNVRSSRLGRFNCSASPGTQKKSVGSGCKAVTRVIRFFPSSHEELRPIIHGVANKRRKECNLMGPIRRSIPQVHPRNPAVRRHRELDEITIESAFDLSILQIV